TGPARPELELAPAERTRVRQQQGGTQTEGRGHSSMQVMMPRRPIPLAVPKHTRLQRGRLEIQPRQLLTEQRSSRQHPPNHRPQIVDVRHDSMRPHHSPFKLARLDQLIANPAVHRALDDMPTHHKPPSSSSSSSGIDPYTASSNATRR